MCLNLDFLLYQLVRPDFQIICNAAILLLKDELDPQKPLKIGDPKRKVVFQPSIFRCELLVSGRVCHKVKRWFVTWESEARLFAFQTLVICCMQGTTWLHRDYSKPLWGSLQAPTQSQPFKERGDTTACEKQSKMSSNKSLTDGTTTAGQ